MDWNECPESNGIGVRIAPEWVSGMPRNTQLKYSSSNVARETKERNIKEKKKGYSQADYAFVSGAGFISRLLGGHSGTFVVSRRFAYEERPILNKVGLSPHSISVKIKRAARFYGADLVGICKNDLRWIYYPRLNHENKKVNFKEFPSGYYHVVVLGVEMNYDLISASPSAF